MAYSFCVQLKEKVRDEYCELQMEINKKLANYESGFNLSDACHHFDPSVPFMKSDYVISLHAFPVR